MTTRTNSRIAHYAEEFASLAYHYGYEVMQEMGTKNVKRITPKSVDVAADNTLRNIQDSYNQTINSLRQR